MDCPVASRGEMAASHTAARSLDAWTLLVSNTKEFRARYFILRSALCSSSHVQQFSFQTKTSPLTIRATGSKLVPCIGDAGECDCCCKDATYFTSGATATDGPFCEPTNLACEPGLAGSKSNYQSKNSLSSNLDTFSPQTVICATLLFASGRRQPRPSSRHSF